MLGYYLKTMGFHFLICSALLGLLILAPTIMTAVLLGLGAYAVSLILIISVFTPTPSSSLPLWLSLIAPIFVTYLILPAIQPWILTSLVPVLMTPVGFIVITLVLVSLATEFFPPGSTYNPLRLMFSSKTRKALARDYNALPILNTQNSVDRHRQVSNNAASASRPTAVNPRTRELASNAAFVRQSRSEPPLDFKINPRALSDITLSAKEQKALLKKQITALEKLDQLVIAQQEGNYGFNDAQMDFYRQFLMIERNHQVCSISLERYGELSQTYGFLYKETYQARSKTWEIEPGHTHFFSTSSVEGLCRYFTSKKNKPDDVIRHPILQEPLVTLPYTRYRFHATRKLGEYDQKYNAECYQHFLNTDVIYYAEQIIASGPELNNSAQFSR